ncbi:hypothetical protein DITRI_Ditri10aG0047000 [Diplodiscus trichospermus]
MLTTTSLDVQTIAITSGREGIIQLVSLDKASHKFGDRHTEEIQLSPEHTWRICYSRIINANPTSIVHIHILKPNNQILENKETTVCIDDKRQLGSLGKTPIAETKAASSSQMEVNKEENPSLVKANLELDEAVTRIWSSQ